MNEDAKSPPPAVAFVAESGTGKTTLIEKLISALGSRGYRVGALKHAHHGFEIDRPGKDSYRMAAAGAEAVLIVSDDRLAHVRRHDREPLVEELLGRYFGGLDVVLVEGFKDSALPKIEVHRKATGKGLLCRGARHDPRLLAVASDEPMVLDVPVLRIEDTDALADFVAARVIGPTPAA